MKIKTLNAKSIKRVLLLILLNVYWANNMMIIGQKTASYSDTNKNDWWIPLLKKHNIGIQKSKFLGSVFVNSSIMQIYKDSSVFTDAKILMRGKDTYSIITAKQSTFYNLDSTIVMGQSINETFDNKSNSLKPVRIDYYKFYKDEISKSSSSVVCDSSWSDSTFLRGRKTKKYDIGIKK
jgi:hypothetical protein